MEWSYFKKYFKKQYLSESYYERKTKVFYELRLSQMARDDLINKFLELLRSVQGIQKPLSIRQISAMQFKKCIRKGCQIYAIQVTNLMEKENKPSLEDFVVLHDFRDVFVDEIPELPPRREIDFSIDLLPGSTPISKAPYRMSLLELTVMSPTS